jgi:hypothetical protein
MAKPWKSAEIITQQNFKYGAFEARIRGAEGSGMITAFFLYKNGSEWAGAEWQEQDFELFGKNGGFQTQVMTPGDPRVEHVVNHRAATPIWDRYYTYRMEWTPTALSFYVDGKLVRRETDPVMYAKILDPARAEPMNLRISLWAGDIPWSGAFDSTKVPAAVDVNWAQVYSYTPGTGPDGSDFSLLWKDDFDRIDNSRWYLANWTFDYAVNDYAPGGARASDGYLQLKMTHWSEEGTRFTPSPVDDGLLKPPGSVIEPPAVVFPVYEFPDRRVILPDTFSALLSSRYADSTPANTGSSTCGSEALDMYVAKEGGCMVGGITANEWAEYAVTTLETSDWDVAVRVAAGVAGAKFRMSIDGVPVGDVVELPLGSWESFQNVQLGKVSLPAGDHVVRLDFLARGMNLKQIAFARAGGDKPGPEATLVTGPIHIPSAILAKNYTRAFDLTSKNLGGKCRTGAVDLQFSTDLYQDCNLGWAQATEWIEYDVFSLQAGSFDLSLRLASALASKTVQIGVNGVNLPAPIPAPVAGWTTYSTVPAGRITLPAGTSTIRVTFPEGDVNFHWMRLERVAPEALPPAVVGGLLGVAGEASAILSWQASAGAVGYDVERSSDDGATFSVVKSTGNLTWTDLDVTSGVEYLYRVVAKGLVENAAASEVVRVVPQAIPVAAVPQGLVATAGDGQVALSWEPAANAAGYVVFRSTGGAAAVEIARPASNSFLDSDVLNGTGYTYQVRSFRGAQESDLSDPVVATPLGLPPQAVASLLATAGDAQVTLSWTSSVRATSYSIRRATGTGAYETVASVTATTWRDEAVVNGTSYTYQVIAANAEGFAEASPAVTATPIEPPPVTASVRLEYMAGNTGSTNGIRPLLRLVNTGAGPLDLSKVKIRYWFTRDGAVSNNYWCDWAAVGSANIVGTFQNLSASKPTADTYLEIGFKSAAGSLAAGASTGEIQSRFSKSDWSNYNQANDASYDGTASSYRASTTTTVYLDGVLIWGTEP